MQLINKQKNKIQKIKKILKNQKPRSHTSLERLKKDGLNLIKMKRKKKIIIILFGMTINQQRRIKDITCTFPLPNQNFQLTMSLIILLMNFY